MTRIDTLTPDQIDLLPVGCDQVALCHVEGGEQKWITIDATRIAEITPIESKPGGPGSPPPSRLPS